MIKLAMAQHLGMISNSKAFIYLKDNKIIKSMKNLSKTDNSVQIPHPSCFSAK